MQTATNGFILTPLIWKVPSVFVFMWKIMVLTGLLMGVMHVAHIGHHISGLAASSGIIVHVFGRSIKYCLNQVVL